MALYRAVGTGAVSERSLCWGVWAAAGVPVVASNPKLTQFGRVGGRGGEFGRCGVGTSFLSIKGWHEQPISDSVMKTL